MSGVFLDNNGLTNGNSERYLMKGLTEEQLKANLKAARGGDMAYLQANLTPENVDAQDVYDEEYEGRTVLLEAICAREAIAVAFILSLGPDLNLEDGEENNAEECADEHPGMCQLLWQHNEKLELQRRVERMGQIVAAPVPEGGDPDLAAAAACAEFAALSVSVEPQVHPHDAELALPPMPGSANPPRVPVVVTVFNEPRPSEHALVKQKVRELKRRLTQLGKVLGKLKPNDPRRTDLENKMKSAKKRFAHYKKLEGANKRGSRMVNGKRISLRVRVLERGGARAGQQPGAQPDGPAR